jgi:uncharacterized protein YecT (DUF1311 family)
MTRWPAVSVALILLPALLMGAAYAQPAKPKPAAKPTSNYERCLASASGMSTAGMIECANAELRVQDGRLNNAYQGAILRLERPRQKVALQKAQRAWIAFRDADCAALYDEDWGSMARVQANACVLEHTRRRADELERFRKFD